MSNSDYLLRSLRLLEKRAGVLQDEPASSGVVIYVDFGYAARVASRLSWSDFTPTSAAITSSTSDLLF